MKKKFNHKKLFRNLGINKGETLYIASDIMLLLLNNNSYGMRFNVENFINCLQETVGDKGTLIFPTYNWDFCNRKTFDYNNTLGQCGALSNVALKRKDFKRTKHPIYSLAVWGKYKNILCKMNNKSSWGLNSPFDFMYKKKTKYLFVGIDYKDAFTMDHYFEQLVNVKYRFHKTFTSNYINEKKIKTRKKYTMFVRKKNLCDATKISHLLDRELLKLKSLKKIKLNNVLFSLINLDKVDKVIINDLKSKKSKFIFPLKN